MERPRDINLAAVLVLVACLINAGATLKVLGPTRPAATSIAVSATIAVTLVGWLVFGRSGIARLALTVWLGFGITSALLSYASILADHRAGAMAPLTWAASLLAFALYSGALALLWSRLSSLWLRRGA